jgi:hypothetical protein
MSDPLSLALLGGVGLTEGIKFLYGQAGELLARWQDRKARRVHAEEPLVIESSLLEGKLMPAHANEEMVERLQAELVSGVGRSAWQLRQRVAGRRSRGYRDA